MSWKEESSKAGLAGLTPEEAGVGALLSPMFQNLLDPIDNPHGDIIVVSIQL